MRPRSTAIGALAVLAAAVGQLWADPAGGRGGERAADRRAAFESLQLTQDQRAQLRDLRARGREQLQQLRVSGEVTRDAARALRRQHREALADVLTDQQRATLAQLRADAKADRPEGDGARSPRGPRARRPGADPAAGQALDLTPQQRDRLRALRQDVRAQLRDLRASASATREQARALRQDLRQQMADVLTDQQRALLAARRARRAARDAGPAGEATDVESAVAVPTAVAQTTWGRLKSRSSD